MISNSDRFGRLGERERRKVFDKPLSEIVRLLEFNLLEKFWHAELRLQGAVLRNHTCTSISAPVTVMLLFEVLHAQPLLGESLRCFPSTSLHTPPPANESNSVRKSMSIVDLRL